MDTLLRLVHNIKLFGCSIWLVSLWSILLFSACSSNDSDVADKLNTLSYAYHYRSLDSTEVYARKAFAASESYNAGKAEALNNLAFVNIARMDYQKAAQQLDSAINITDNQVELLVAEIQYMRLCQRQSHNKLFYIHQEKAKKYLDRIIEDKNLLNSHQLKRLIYAQSEYYINLSAYYYYVGLVEPSIETMKCIDPDGDIQKDTAQYLNYLYNVGAGGIITNADANVVANEEFNYLTQCYIVASQRNYPYWKAQALQAISEHLLSPSTRQILITNYRPFLDYINTDGMDYSLLAGNLAQRSLNIFTEYKDVYQTAGAYRTLAGCYWEIDDYPSALICLNSALEADTIINRAPDLVASIREQLCLVYSAQNDKVNSDINRNYYLDLQEQTRQDKQLEARAYQLDKSSKTLNAMIVAVLFMIAVVLFVLVYFARKRKQKGATVDIDELLLPLKKWNIENNKKLTALDDKLEEVQEQTALVRLSEEKNKQRNLEQRAKLALVNSITPFIDRIINEINKLNSRHESAELREERLKYISELTDEINEYNNVLTRWIQMQQGRVSLRIESFSINELFDIVAKSKMSYSLKGISLCVEPSTAVVKADRVLTLFMINTLADNARKFTPVGGKVTIKAEEKPDYVEVSISDTGCGMDENKLAHVFDNKHIADDGTTSAQSHGFGLLNCKGIIENYKKISRIFAVCDINADSSVGKGSRFAFRLPKGVVRMIMALMVMVFGFTMPSYSVGNDKVGSNNKKPTISRLNTQEQHLNDAARFADSAYYSNLNGTYAHTLACADSCMKYLNMHIYAHAKSKTDIPKMVLFTTSSAMPAEILWFHKEIESDYAVILDIRNETAVAALALHKWDLYRYNNKVYTRLFHECYADASLPHYVQTMQKAENNKWVAIVILVLLLISIPPIYYMVYYRHIIYYKVCVERIHAINEILLGNGTDEDKLKCVEEFNSKTGNLGIAVLDKVVDQILATLRANAESSEHKAEQLEYAHDELRQAERENNILYVDNSVLDNCLSALKHETMYFPSRIKQSIETKDCDIQVVAELVTYYKQLYSLLSAQAMRQIERPYKVDRDTMRYLFDLLKKLNGGCKPDYQVKEKDCVYVQLAFAMTSLNITSVQAQQLFTPLTLDVNFLICRQIVRELGEVTNLRACGIVATADNIIEITIPKAIWKNLIS